MLLVSEDLFFWNMEMLMLKTSHLSQVYIIESPELGKRTLFSETYIEPGQCIRGVEFCDFIESVKCPNV